MLFVVFIIFMTIVGFPFIFDTIAGGGSMPTSSSDVEDKYRKKQAWLAENGLPLGSWYKIESVVSPEIFKIKKSHFEKEGFYLKVKIPKKYNWFDPRELEGRSIFLDPHYKKNKTVKINGKKTKIPVVHGYSHCDLFVLSWGRNFWRI